MASATLKEKEEEEEPSAFLLPAIIRV